ncbi:50S ribosomal protein L10 [Rickettsiales endosymbiont of Stachyamoeba lipophora]|uniref:50S ribosomal protein L10 n=1 Tax=Rickettsiales endosymbiont of Stachyamoeba lipophora TaxID=2486578 RepID=UPI000F64BF35|nr:50S ribosomal protein L10 [Rickettsiales endosymbiont of Stachyamoeba lipophora]AZL15944.1 50S ribosomal protein L10 [Rickettsiales endosymbiont of Stachyamoeba lipophora]
MGLSVNQQDKREQVAGLHNSFSENEIAIVLHYPGLTVSEFSALRNEVRGANAKIEVVKNTLARLAIEGTIFECLKDILTGPTAIAYSTEPGFAKKIVEFSKKNDKLKVIGGALNGQLMDEKAVRVLATLPSLDELRAKIVGVISAPARSIASAIHGVPSAVARVISAYATENKG